MALVASHIPKSAFDPIVLVVLVVVGTYVVLTPTLGESTALRFTGHALCVELSEGYDRCRKESVC